MAITGKYYNVVDQSYGVNCYMRDPRYGVQVLGERYFMGFMYAAVAYVAVDSWGNWLVFQGYVLPELLLPLDKDQKTSTRRMIKRYDLDGITLQEKPHRKASKHKKRKRKGWN